MLVAISLTALSSLQWLGPAPARPVSKVVTLAPSLTDTVLALEAKDVLVGVSRFDERPEVQGLPRVGGFIDPSVETVLALKPGLLVVQKSPGNQKPVEALAALGVPVLALSLTTIADIGEAITALGDVLGRQSRAKQLVDALEQARAEQRRAAPRRAATVLFVYGFSPLVVAGPGAFAHELLADCGVENAAAAAKTAYPVWSTERLVAKPPDVIVDASDSREGVDAVKRLARRSRWVTLPNKDLLHPGPALATALAPLCAALRP